MSANDIQAGARWAAELTTRLADCNLGIICLTNSNVDSPWLLFEAGSLAKQFERSRVIPYLTGISSADVEFPLAQFQGTPADYSGTKALLESVNEMSASPLSKDRLEFAFEKWWPDLEARLRTARSVSDGPRPPRPTSDVLAEILELVRSQALAYPQAAVGDTRTRRAGVSVLAYWHSEGLTEDWARSSALEFENAGLTALIKQHRDPRCPDAAFIGALVSAADARFVLRGLPYKIEYLFPPDYPTVDGGDPSGLLIGIGYLSSHNADGPREATAIPVTSEHMDQLLAAGISNTEFQQRLRAMTLPRA